MGAIAIDRIKLMRMRSRKLVGALGLLTLVIVWMLGAMALAQAVLPEAGDLVKFAYYAAAGMGWALPAMPMIKWMSRPDPA